MNERELCLTESNTFGDNLNIKIYLSCTEKKYLQFKPAVMNQLLLKHVVKLKTMSRESDIIRLASSSIVMAYSYGLLQRAFTSVLQRVDHSTGCKPYIFKK